MSKRITVGVDPGCDLGQLERELRAAGAEGVSAPTASLPDVMVIALPDNQDEAAFIRRASDLAGVRYAEADAWAGTGPLIK